MERVIGVKTDYAISGKGGDAKTSEYLASVMDDTLAEKTKPLRGEKNEERRASQQSYIEQTLRSDLLRALHARGYYGATVGFAAGKEPLSGRYDITYGKQFTISRLRVVPEKYAKALPARHPVAGDPLDAEAILALQSALTANIGKDKCYFSLSVANRVTLDRARRTGTVDLVVTTGREGRFGPLRFKGNDTVSTEYLRRMVPWKEGDCFRRDKVESFKSALMQTQLFSQADVVLPENGPGRNGNVPATVTVKERAQRTVGAGLTFYSDEGIGGVLKWEHRNFFGAGEKLKAALNLSSLKQSIDTSFEKPYFLGKNQTLTLTATAQRQDTNAYRQVSLDTGAAISRKFGRYFYGSTGINASLQRVNDDTLNTNQTFGLLSAPQTIGYDSRDNTLDPRRGLNASLTAQPFVDLLGEANPFLKTRLAASCYLRLDKSGDNLIAAKAGIGSILGTDLDSVPASERFYAGGGGTVRGYSYQKVGPKVNGDPSGGLSIATASLELRSKFTETFGGVAFVDAGSVSDTASLQFNNMAVGAGLGVRYYTSFGPIRFDVARPLTQKADINRPYQFYLSIGQAF